MCSSSRTFHLRSPGSVPPYYEAKRLLRSMPDVKYGLKGLTGFRITKDGTEHTFDTPTATMAFVKQHKTVACLNRYNVLELNVSFSLVHRLLTALNYVI